MLTRCKWMSQQMWQNWQLYLYLLDMTSKKENNLILLLRAQAMLQHLLLLHYTIPEEEHNDYGCLPILTEFLQEYDS